MSSLVPLDMHSPLLRRALSSAERLLLEAHAPRLALHAAYAASLLGPWRRFRRLLAKPERAGQLRLKQIISANRETEFGTAHDFSRIDSIHQYQSRVPIRTFEEFEPYIQRAIAGRPNVLTKEDVIGFAQTSGAGNFTKLIPYTKSLLSEFHFATAAGFGDLFIRHPELLGKKTYSALSPEVHRDERFTAGGLPIRMQTEFNEFDPLARLALGQLAVTADFGAYSKTDVDSAPKVEAVLREWRLTTAAALLSASDLGWISIGSPTFLFPVFDVIKSDWSSVASRINHRARRNLLNQLFSAYRPDQQAHGMQKFLAAAWPSLKVLSCWADAAAADAALRLGDEIPDHVELDAKGLVATEAVVTIPFSGAPDPVVAVGSHFYEFLDLERPAGRARLPHELKVGGLYSPIISTAGGLYRYHLRDMMYCTGRNRGTPTLRFRGRLDRTSDLCGEKLDAAQVERAFEIACSLTGFRPEFFMLSPKRGRLATYVAFIEAARPAHELVKFVNAVEVTLKKNPSYAQALELKELGPIETVQVENGFSAWEGFMLSRGQRLDAIKLARLDADHDWLKILAPQIKKHFTKNQTDNFESEATVPVRP